VEENTDVVWMLPQNVPSAAAHDNGGLIFCDSFNDVGFNVIKVPVSLWENLWCYISILGDISTGLKQ